jgi:hypothetical protein
MANEAVCIEKPTRYARYTCDDATGIAKGTILKLSGDNKVYASSAQDVPAGIAVMEKVASDSTTEISAALDGVWDIKCELVAVTNGAVVTLSGANLIRNTVEADFPLGKYMGRALEAGDASEVIRVRLSL